MPGIKIDPSIARVVLNDFHFPLGVYPVEDMTPKPGYAMHFEPADGGPDADARSGPQSTPGPSSESDPTEDGLPASPNSDWEEWPDRYAFDIVVSAERLPSLCRALFMLFPGRVYPILDVLGQDAFREIDPYIAYDLVGLDHFLDGVREFGDFLFEDGMCGFGVMSEEPFLYVFLDEHKIVTVRAQPEAKERVERVLAAFDLELTEQAAGADAAAHEHRSVLIAPPDRPDLWMPEQVVEELQDRWRMLLNVDPDTNLDDNGRELGVTSWRALVRCEYDDGPVRYAEAVFDAENLRQAEHVAFVAVEELSDQDADDDSDTWSDAKLVIIDRMTPKQLAQVLAAAGQAAEQAASRPVKSDAKSKSRPVKSAKTSRSKIKDAESSRKPNQNPSEPLPGHVYFARWLDA